MKVVYIKSQYVETDAVNFKSVVQNLTGKDSTIVVGSPSLMTETMKRQKNNSERDLGHGRNYSFMTRDLPFKEVDRLLKELPPLDELHKLLAFH